MARARNIKPGFYTNEDLAECSVWARYIFPGLWMMADREGRLEYRPKKIKGELLRFDEQAAEPLLDELQRWGFIKIYEAEGRAYIQILTFHKHQNPHHREAESDIPPMQSPGLSPHGTTSKPGATNGSDEGEAQGETEASPGMEPEDATCQGGQAGLIPDSGFLIPDSLIPDSLIGSATDGGTPHASDEKTHAAAVEISKSLREWERARGKFPRNITPSQEQVIELASCAPTAQELRRAYELAVEARDNANDPGPINAAFVRTKLEQLRRPPPGRAAQPRSYHDERADVIAQLTGRKAAHQSETDGVIDVDAHAIPRLG